MTVGQQLTAPCGLYCAACPLYLARTDEALRQKLSSQFGAPAEMMRCEGCRPTNGSPMPLRGQVCATYACARDKGVTFCHACEEFPCRMLHPAAERAGSLPHNAKLMSLLVMKRDGLESWARQYPLLARRYFQGKMVIGRGPELPEDEEQTG